MERQHQIKRTLSAPESIEMIRRLLAESAHSNRAALVQATCSQFGFVDARGRAQTAGCVKALRELEHAGHFALPAPGAGGRRRGQVGSARRLEQPVPEPRDVPAAAGDVQGLALVKVQSLEQLRLWNELMACEHPQGPGPLVGAQMRYLIQSEHGWLGGLGFAAAALNLADRDRWIGWDSATRGQHLHRVVGMARLLIRRSVRCHNLASRVLGMALRIVASDYEARYGYRPWLLESFVDTEQFLGTCYQAANWLAIGHSQGRGRQDRTHQAAKSVKAIYVYPLQPDWRARLGVSEPLGPEPLQPGDGLDGPAWAEQEFGGAELGDLRLSARLVDCARTLGAAPGRAFSAAARGERAAVKGHYRLIDMPDDSAVSVQAMLAPHRQRTEQRMMAQPVVLCVQDGTQLNYTGLAQCQGLGALGSNQTGARSAGLHLHSTLAFTAEGLPLGVLDARLQAPPARADDPAPSARIPIEDKKTFDWIHGLRQCEQAAARMPHTRVVSVMDREADFFELFDAQRQRKRVDLLVRAKHDRLIAEQSTMFDQVRSAALQSRLSIAVPRQSSRPKKSKSQARAGHPKRMAQVQLRWREVVLSAPKHHAGKQPLRLWVVHVRETRAPAGVARLEWFLLSTRQITCVEQASECLRWYCLRWRIEDWHRVLKSGCRVEALQHKTATRLKRAIAFNLVIAWRIMLLTLLGRQAPELAAHVLFSDLEIEVLQAYAKKTASNDPYCSARPSAS
jgi:Domain of unknown function (DUF4338)/Transposase DNA-binding